MGKSLEEISKIASEWWADKVINPNFDNGDTSGAGIFGKLLANANTKPVDSQSREKFISFLSNSIESKLNQERKWGRPNIILDVDYGPCKELAEAGEYAGISTSNFPWKTTMWIDKNHISVSYGYRAKEEFLYVNKEYWQKQIESTKKAIEEYKNGAMLSWIEDEEERYRTAKERIAEFEKHIEEYQLNKENTEI